MGPCKFRPGKENTAPVNNTFSFNNYANMLYIDQPIGTGFSYGDSPVASTTSAAPYVWKLIQAFYTAFPEYKSRDFGIFTESYGGHYGPEFVKFIQSQNKEKVGENINVVALGINNGWHSSELQEPAYVTYSYNNSYRPIIDKGQYDKYTDYLNDYCIPEIQLCERTKNNLDCSNADRTCYAVVERPIYSQADFDIYDIRALSNNTDPPNNYIKYLQSPAVIKAIGARSTFSECSPSIHNKFAVTGDST